MDKGLPKQLEIILDGLIHECLLSSWSLHGNTNMTTLTIRFRSDTEAITQDETSVKYKRIAPSQLKRDSNRAKMWKDCGDGMVVLPKDTDKKPPLDITKSKVKSTKSSAPAVSSPPQHSSTCAPNTRSRSRLNSMAKPFQPSPIPQADGATDSRPHLDYSLVQNEDVQNGEARELKGWQQALLDCADKASGSSFPTNDNG